MNVVQNSLNTPQQKRCTQCGAAFGCGAGTSKYGKSCWCMDLPAVLPVPEAKNTHDCLCPECLKNQLSGQM